MRRASSFEELNAAFEYRILRLNLLAQEAQGFPLPRRRQATSYLIIELHNCWTGFARASFVSSMCGVETLSGTWAEPATGRVHSTADAVNAASAFASPRGARHHEPHWFDKTIITRLATNFALSNSSSVLNAFSYQTSFFAVAPAFRNYFAHKCEETAKKVETLRSRRFAGLGGCPTQLITESSNPATAPLMLEWLYDVKAMGNLLLQ